MAAGALRKMSQDKVALEKRLARLGEGWRSGGTQGVCGLDGSFFLTSALTYLTI